MIIRPWSSALSTFIPSVISHTLPSGAPSAIAYPAGTGTSNVLPRTMRPGFGSGGKGDRGVGGSAAVEDGSSTTTGTAGFASSGVEDAQALNARAINATSRTFGAYPMT